MARKRGGRIGQTVENNNLKKTEKDAKFSVGPQNNTSISTAGSTINKSSSDTIASFMPKKLSVVIDEASDLQGIDGEISNDVSLFGQGEQVFKVGVSPLGIQEQDKDKLNDNSDGNQLWLKKDQVGQDASLARNSKKNRNNHTKGKEKSISLSGPWSDIGEVKIVEPDHLAKVNISNRRGNYLLSVGLPRSGKTVLQSFMTYYMDVAGKLDAQLDNTEKDGTVNHEAQRIKTNWLESWKKGDLPESTSVGEDEIRELRLTVRNQENSGQKFNLSFLEISGESFLSVVPNRNSIPKLFNRLIAFLTNKHVKINLVFLLKTDEQNNISCDALFTNFIAFLRNEIKGDFRKKISLILVLPDTRNLFGEDEWLKARNNRQVYKKMMKSYVYKNFPATYREYDKWVKDKRAIISFNIGDIKNGRLTNQNFDDVKGFINLNYRFFSGKSLSPRFKWFRKLTGS
mgnify:FL=1